MLPKDIYDLFESLKACLIKTYPGVKENAECLIDIGFKRCRIADRDHYKEYRVFMHTGCEPNTICVTSSIDMLDTDCLVGLFCHEIGHVICFQFPEMISECLSEKEQDLLEELDDDELRADHVMLLIFEIRIFYNARKIQWAKLPIGD